MYMECYTDGVLTLVTTILSIALQLQCFYVVSAYNKGYLKGYLYVRHLSVTGMTGMTRNMESTREYETAQKFTEKLSFLSLVVMRNMLGFGFDVRDWNDLTFNEQVYGAPEYSLWNRRNI